MPRSFSLQSSGGVIPLGGASPFKLLRTMKGTGLPPVQNQWFEGAGNGASWRTARVLPRRLDLPFKITGANRQVVWSRFEALARVFAPEAGPVRMRITLDGEEWFTEFRREGGGDPSWADSDTDGETVLMTVISVKSGDPFFTRADATSQQIALGGLGRGLIKATSLSKLQVSTTNSFGQVDLFNPGSVGATARWVLAGPYDAFELISPSGQILRWDAGLDQHPAPGVGESITVDFEFGTAVDNEGRNRFAGFDGVPVFWRIPPGTNRASVELLNGTGDSSVTIFFNPKRWVVF